MSFEPNPKRRENLVALRKFVDEQEAGARVSWLEVEQATGVRMGNQLSRNLFRAACIREKRGYIALPGGGVEFSSAGNAVECVTRYAIRVNGAIASAAEKSSYVVERHAREMSGEAARELLRNASLLALLASLAKPAKADAIAKPAKADAVAKEADAVAKEADAIAEEADAIAEVKPKAKT